MVKRRVKGKDTQPEFNKLVCLHDSNRGTVQKGCPSNTTRSCTMSERDVTECTSVKPAATLPRKCITNKGRESTNSNICTYQ